MSAAGSERGGGACARCGAELTVATAHLSELGPVCWPCSVSLETLRERDRALMASHAHALDSRARRLAVVHVVIWGTIALLATRALSAWVSVSVVAPVLALGVALFTRSRWAFPVALIVDGAGTLALLVWGIAAGGLAWLVSAFSLSLIALTLTARDAFPRVRERRRREDSNDVTGGLESGTRPGRAWARPRWLAPVAATALVSVGAGVAVYLVTHRPDPALTLMRSRLTAWQLERAQPESTAGGSAARELSSAARRWPRVATSLERLDQAFPDEPATRAAVQQVNGALADAGLPYLIEMWPGPGDRPVILGHRIMARVPWHVGARTIDVLRLMRVDERNVEFAMAGVTDEGLPVVLMDRVEAALARDVPAAYGADRTERAARSLNDFDRAALRHLRAFLDQRFQGAMTAVGAGLAERDDAVEQMRGRLQDGRLQFADMPERFVLGDDWLARLKPAASSSRTGGPLILTSDLKVVAQADERLRHPEMARVLADLTELAARSVEAHEARHAVDEVSPVGPPPPALSTAMETSSTAMIAAADRELRAFLGELHDGPMTACASLATLMRCLYGRGASRTPHSFAVIALLEQLDPESQLAPVEQLDALCRVPDAELRARVEAVWRTLYGAPMPPGARAAGPRAGTERPDAPPSP